MKVLVVGGGGREHALCWKIAQSPRVSKLYCAPGNGGIAQLAQCVDIAATDVEAMVRFAVDEKMDLVVVAPDDPLAQGMVDALAVWAIPAFGPTQAAARLESSKHFAKRIMQQCSIPTAQYRIFRDGLEALSYAQTCPLPIVVKADGLALGKGVLIAHTREDVLHAVRMLMLDKVMGAAGERILMEEYLTGPEATLLVFCDGEHAVPMVTSMDYKRAGDGNTGMNTGGMGSISPNPYLSDAQVEKAMEEIVYPTLRAMQVQGCPFKGILYVGLMLTPGGMRVIEYNARFGDPETQVVLPRLKTDLVDIMLACIHGRLDELQVEWLPGASACVVLASGGYPGEYETGKTITGIQAAQEEGAMVFHAGTRAVGEDIVTSGGRVLCATACGETLGTTLDTAYRAAECIRFEGMYRRSDIGRV